MNVDVARLKDSITLDFQQVVFFPSVVSFHDFMQF